MQRRAFLLLGAATLSSASCRSFAVEANFKRPSELTATAVALNSATRLPLGRLAFIRGGDLWIKELPDGPDQRLTQDGRNDLPLWSASGEWLAFRKQPVGSSLPEAWVIRRTGGDARQVDLVDAGSGFPAATLGWSPLPPDRLAYVAQDGLFVVNADGTDPRTLVGRPDKGPGPQVLGIAWSPDAGWLAVQRWERSSTATASGQNLIRPVAQSLWHMRADGSEGQGIVESADANDNVMLLGDWSPDGSWLVYWLLPQLGMSILADGVPLRKIGGNGGASFQVSPRMLAHRDFLAWSPDGQSLALVDGGLRECWDEKAIGIASPTQVPTRLSPPGRAELSPAWSPDGRTIALTSAPEAHGVGGGDQARQALQERRIWVMSPDGSHRRALTNDPTYRDERPTWSADGSQLLFARFKGVQAQLWLMDADGQNPRMLVSELTPAPPYFGYYGYVEWSTLYDWWKGPPSIAASTASTPPPGTLATPTSMSTTTTPTAADDPLTAYLGPARAYLESIEGQGVSVAAATVHLKDLAKQQGVDLRYLTASDGSQADGWIGLAEPGDAFMLWRDGTTVRYEVWTNRDLYFVNPVRAFRLVTQGGFLDMGLIPASIGSTGDAVFVLARYVGGHWQEVWSPFPQTKDSWASSGGSVDFVGAGIDTLHLKGPIPSDVPASRVFDEFGAALKQEYESEWQRRGDTYVRVSGQIIPTLFTSLANFIDKLQHGDHAGAVALAVDPSVVDQARQLGLDQPASGRGWWATNQSATNGSVTIIFFDNADRSRRFAVALVEANGAWRVKAIDKLPPVGSP